MVLTTPRLTLAPFGAGDLDELHRLWIDPDVRRHLWDDVIIPRERAAQVVEESVEGFAAYGFGLWTLRAESGAPLVGFSGLRRFGEAAQVELIYGLHSRHWGKGLATEASAAVLRFGFGDIGLERIYGRTDPPNAASRRVLERLGMRFVRLTEVGELDTVEYVLSREEFLRRDPG